MAAEYRNAVFLNGTKILIAPIDPDSTTRKADTYAVTLAVGEVGDDSVTLTAPSPVRLFRGSELQIGSRLLSVGGFVGTTGTEVPLETPLTAAIAANASAILTPYARLIGGSQANFSGTDQNVSVRSFESGLFTDAKKVSISGSIAYQGYVPKADPCIDLVVIPYWKSEAEVFVRVIYPSGQQISGASMISSLNFAAALDEILRTDFSLPLQGEFDFDYIPGTAPAYMIP